MNKWLILVCIALFCVCLLQPWWLRRADEKSSESQAVAEKALQKSLVDIATMNLSPPPGAPDERMQFGNIMTSQKDGSLVSTYLEGGLTLDVSNVQFTRNAVRVREDRVSDIAAHYAFQIAKAIPDSYVTSGIGHGGGRVGTLNSVYLLKHSYGHIVVSASYTAEKDGKITDKVRVDVISSNLSGEGRKQLADSPGRFGDSE